MTFFVQKILVDSDRHKFAMTQNVRKRCRQHCYIAEVYEETFDVNIKIVQTMQNNWNLACE